LNKTAGSGLGVTVSGGCDREGRPRISNLRASGIAAKYVVVFGEEPGALLSCMSVACVPNAILSLLLSATF